MKKNNVIDINKYRKDKEKYLEQKKNSKIKKSIQSEGFQRDEEERRKTLYLFMKVLAAISKESY